VNKVKLVNDLAAEEIPDDVQMSINKLAGVDAETFKKFGPKDRQ
jgi:hypothetical protein